MAFKPLLFLLDYHLSDMNALDLYDQLQQIEGLANMTAVILTASFSLVLEQAATDRRLGLLPKPFDVEDLLQIIEEEIETQSGQQKRETA